MLLGYADAKAQSNSSRAENYMGIRGRPEPGGKLYGASWAPLNPHGLSAVKSPYSFKPSGKLYGDSGAPLNRSPAENYMGIRGRP